MELLGPGYLCSARARGVVAHPLALPSCSPATPRQRSGGTATATLPPLRSSEGRGSGRGQSQSRGGGGQQSPGVLSLRTVGRGTPRVRSAALTRGVRSLAARVTHPARRYWHCHCYALPPSLLLLREGRAREGGA
jgi:hypothetical protein